jgi:hypothetical protein
VTGGSWTACMLWLSSNRPHKPPSLWGSLLVLAFFLFILDVDRALRDAWISLKWLQAEAEILEVMPPGAWQSGFRGQKGYPYEVTVLVQTDDGRAFPGQLTEPLFSRYANMQSMRGTANAPPPQPTDRIIVHLHPAGDGRVMPRDNLYRRGGGVLVFFFISMIALRYLFERHLYLRQS